MVETLLALLTGSLKHSDEIYAALKEAAATEGVTPDELDRRIRESVAKTGAAVDGLVAKWLSGLL